ncbi:type II secretion system inner membrane protein GspF [Thermithiobacillus plumbiphilus]|uniref:General secretion pathway protein F n=1 Tax=Thermithiobacillus plumbiphilus TaxID=1729899 RepID=A0ABU9D9I6_9PROT
MAAFEFEAMGQNGRTQRGVLEGDTARQVRVALRERGLIPVRVEPIRSERSGSGGTIRLRRGLPAAQLALVTRQFATLLAAGLTIEQSLNGLIEQSESPRATQILAGVRTGVLSGQSLAVAMGAYPAAFPEIYRTLIRAGESSGRLDSVMLSLADYTEDRQALRQKVVLAMVYPALVSLVAIAVVLGLLTYVVPQVVQVFESTDQVLPLLTRMLIGLSDFLRATGIYWLILFAVLAVIGLRLLRKPAWRWRLDTFLLKVPVVGRLIRGLNAARLASTLSILVGGGVPLLSALQAAQGVVNNLPMREALEEAERQVREGGSLHRALKRSGRFPPMMVHLIGSGEASGQLGPLLSRAADQQRRELEGWVGALTALLEPMMILTMGGVVLTIVLAILMPIFEMNQLVK